MIHPNSEFDALAEEHRQRLSAFDPQHVLVNMVLTGKASTAWDIDVSTGRKVGESYQTTSLQKAAFLRPDKTQDLGFARCSISGLLLCGAGLGSLPTIGVLHPNPVRPFDPALLPGIEFGRVDVDCSSGQLKVHWPTERL